MEARQAFKIIQWYNVYSGEISSDDEDHSIYISLLNSLIGCHDIIEECGMTYDQYYFNLTAQQFDYPSDLDIEFEESLLD
jgi:hypothetical protein